MTDLIYPKAILDLAPADKQGYAPGFPSPQPKEGFVLHSMVGSYAAARGRLMSTDRASWHFSVLKDGTVYQHFRDPRAVAWHCGVLGDLDTFTAAIGNLTLIGIEHEGGPVGNVSEPLTAAQLAASIDLQRWLYSVVAEIKRPALRASHFEHNWLSATACPSGRFTAIWSTILTALLEDDMKGIIVQSGDDFYMVGPGYRMYLGKTATGLQDMGWPVLQAGQAGAPATMARLFEIPDLKEYLAGGAAYSFLAELGLKKA